MEYEKIIDPKCSQKTNEMRTRHLKILNKLLNDKEDAYKFHYEILYDYENVILKLEDIFEKPSLYGLKLSQPFSLETRVSYLGSLCKAIRHVELFPSEIYVKYDRYYHDYVLKSKNNVNKRNQLTEINSDLFLETKNQLNCIKYGKNQGNMKKIMKLLLLIDINNNDYGVIRLNDMINTTILPSLSSKYSYLDLDKCEWHILPSCTKNKVERKFKVPKDWIDLIRLVDCENNIEKRWLLYDRNFNKYKTTDSLEHTFLKLVGRNYYDIKHQFVTYLHAYSRMDRIQIIANNMGHSLNVATSRYNDRF